MASDPKQTGAPADFPKGGIRAQIHDWFRDSDRFTEGELQKAFKKFHLGLLRLPAGQSPDWDEARGKEIVAELDEAEKNMDELIKCVQQNPTKEQLAGLFPDASDTFKRFWLALFPGAEYPPQKITDEQHSTLRQVKYHLHLNEVSASDPARPIDPHNYAYWLMFLDCIIISMYGGDLKVSEEKPRELGQEMIDTISPFLSSVGSVPTQFGYCFNVCQEFRVTCSARLSPMVLKGWSMEREEQILNKLYYFVAASLLCTTKPLSLV